MQRKLTVTYKNETRAGNTPFSGPRYISVPALLLKGKWLEELGFEIGTEVVVECQKGKIVIKKQV